MRRRSLLRTYARNMFGMIGTLGAILMLGAIAYVPGAIVADMSEASGMTASHADTVGFVVFSAAYVVLFIGAMTLLEHGMRRDE